MRLDWMVMEIIACPACRGSLSASEAGEELVCARCELAYPVKDDIPVLLVDQARPRNRE